MEDFLAIDIQGPEKYAQMNVITFISTCIYSAEYNAYNIYAANKKREQILLVFQTDKRKVSMTYFNQATGENYLYELLD